MHASCWCSTKDFPMIEGHVCMNNEGSCCGYGRFILAPCFLCCYVDYLIVMRGKILSGSKLSARTFSKNEMGRLSFIVVGILFSSSMVCSCVIPNQINREFMETLLGLKERNLHLFRNKWNTEASSFYSIQLSALWWSSNHKYFCCNYSSTTIRNRWAFLW